MTDDQLFELKQAEKLQYNRSLINPVNVENPSRPAFKKSTWQKADIDPMIIDKSITFESIGGLDHHIKALKEMIVLPLLYPEVFKKFSLTPPRGVLFYGPPGCGQYSFWVIFYFVISSLFEKKEKLLLQGPLQTLVLRQARK